MKRILSKSIVISRPFKLYNPDMLMKTCYKRCSCLILLVNHQHDKCTINIYIYHFLRKKYSGWMRGKCSVELFRTKGIRVSSNNLMKWLRFGHSRSKLKCAFGQARGNEQIKRCSNFSKKTLLTFTSWQTKIRLFNKIHKDETNKQVTY